MFTGKLKEMSRAEAKSLVEQNSGKIISNVNKKLYAVEEVTSQHNHGYSLRADHVHTDNAINDVRSRHNPVKRK